MCQTDRQTVNIKPISMLSTADTRWNWLVVIMLFTLLLFIFCFTYSTRIFFKQIIHTTTGHKNLDLAKIPHFCTDCLAPVILMPEWIWWVLNAGNECEWVEASSGLTGRIPICCCWSLECSCRSASVLSLTSAHKQTQLQLHSIHIILSPSYNTIQHMIHFRDIGAIYTISQ